jgi:hypothetical protein
MVIFLVKERIQVKHVTFLQAARPDGQIPRSKEAIPARGCARLQPAVARYGNTFAAAG